MSTRVIYVAGPMRGIKDFNFPAFHAASAKLRAEGWTVLSPAEADMEDAGFNPSDTSTIMPISHYLMRDTAMLCKSRAIFLLRGWEQSRGARLEKQMAEYLGIEILRQEGAREGD